VNPRVMKLGILYLLACFAVGLFAGPALAKGGQLDDETRFLLIHGCAYYVQGENGEEDVQNNQLIESAAALSDNELINKTKKNLRNLSNSKAKIALNTETVNKIKKRVPILAQDFDALLLNPSVVEQMSGDVGILAVSSKEKIWSITGKSALGASLYTYYLKCRWYYDGRYVESYQPTDWGRIHDAIWNYDSSYDDADDDHMSSDGKSAYVYREGHFYNFWQGLSQHDYPWHSATLRGSGSYSHSQGIHR